MSKSIKFKNNYYLDSKSIAHNKKNLSDILTPIILWENANPTSVISENKTIKFNNKDYDILKIFYLHSTTNAWLYSIEILKGYGTRIAIDTLDGTCYRTLNYVSDNEYTLSTISSNSPYSDLDRLVIPLYIIGYKK